MMNRPTNWRPLVRHKRSQNAGVVYPLVDEGTAVVDAVMASPSLEIGQTRMRMLPSTRDSR
jgi:hypothetical protein